MRAGLHQDALAERAGVPTNVVRWAEQKQYVYLRHFAPDVRLDYATKIASVLRVGIDVVAPDHVLCEPVSEEIRNLGYKVLDIPRPRSPDRSDLRRLALEALAKETERRLTAPEPGTDIGPVVRLLLKKAVHSRTIKARWLDILQARFGFDCEPQSVIEIAGRLGLSRARVDQIVSVALQKLEHFRPLVELVES